MGFFQFLLVLCFINLAVSLECWTCFGGGQCANPIAWVRQTCPNREKNCYKFMRDDGSVYKMGCSYGSCRGAPGWRRGITCDVCNSNMCNGGSLSMGSSSFNGDSNSGLTWKSGGSPVYSSDTEPQTDGAEFSTDKNGERAGPQLQILDNGETAEQPELTQQDAAERDSIEDPIVNSDNLEENKRTARPNSHGRSRPSSKGISDDDRSRTGQVLVADGDKSDTKPSPENIPRMSSSRRQSNRRDGSYSWQYPVDGTGRAKDKNTASGQSGSGTNGNPSYRLQTSSFSGGRTSGDSWQAGGSSNVESNAETEDNVPEWAAGAGNMPGGRKQVVERPDWAATDTDNGGNSGGTNYDSTNGGSSFNGESERTPVAGGIPSSQLGRDKPLTDTIQVNDKTDSADNGGYIDLHADAAAEGEEVEIPEWARGTNHMGGGSSGGSSGGDIQQPPPVNQGDLNVEDTANDDDEAVELPEWARESEGGSNNDGGGRSNSGTSGGGSSDGGRVSGAGFTGGDRSSGGGQVGTGSTGGGSSSDGDRAANGFGDSDSLQNRDGTSGGSNQDDKTSVDSSNRNNGNRHIVSVISSLMTVLVLIFVNMY